MRRLFTDRERPLYGQAEPLELVTAPARRGARRSCPSASRVLDATRARLWHRSSSPLPGIRSARCCSPTCCTASSRLRESGGTTLRVPEVGHLDAQRDDAPSGVPATPPHDLGDQRVEGLALAMHSSGWRCRRRREAHQANWDQLSAGKKAVLAALADGIRPTGSRATERSGLTRAALQSALRELGREGQHVSRVVTGPDAGRTGGSSTRSSPAGCRGEVAAAELRTRLLCGCGAPAAARSRR